jgi:hypothetical protein
MGNNRWRTVISYEEDGQEDVLVRDAFVAGGSHRRSHPPQSMHGNCARCIAVAQRLSRVDAIRGLSQWKTLLGHFFCLQGGGGWKDTVEV